MKKIKILFCLLFSSKYIFSQFIQKPVGSEKFGTTVLNLSNGNYLIADPYYDNLEKKDAGAVYLFDGKTHKLISTLVGGSENDRVGIAGFLEINNEKFLVSSPFWNNGNTKNVGAVTICDSKIGLNGLVSETNSIIGTYENDNFGGTISYDNRAFISVIKSSNTNNHNFIISCQKCDNGNIIDAGAIVLVDAQKGLTGKLTTNNALFGSSNYDYVGEVSTLKNGDFVISSSSWSSKIAENVGAVTQVDGKKGIIGEINEANSIIGNHQNDLLGSYSIEELTNGNYVIRSPEWNDKKGIAILVLKENGTNGTSLSNKSIRGKKNGDRIGSNLINALPNGNFVIASRTWQKDNLKNVGAVTWGNGMIQQDFIVDETNSLVGENENDLLGNNITILKSGNYVVGLESWKDGEKKNVGAVTFADGNKGIAGRITKENSFVGANEGDKVGSEFIIPLENGNFVVSTPNYSNPILKNTGNWESLGAVTFGNGKVPLIGTINTKNSLIGTTLNARLGAEGILPLKNGNYVVWNPVIRGGMLMWCDGTKGCETNIDFLNIGEHIITANFSTQILNNITPLKNGHYIASNISFDSKGAIKIIDGAKSTNQNFLTPNSYIETYYDHFSGKILDLGDKIIVSDPKANSNAGAVMVFDAKPNISGSVEKNEKLILGNQTNYKFGDGGIQILNDSMVVIKSNSNNFGGINNAGSITLINYKNKFAEFADQCNTYFGKTPNGSANLVYEYNSKNNFLIITDKNINDVLIYDLARPINSTQNDPDSINIAVTKNSIFELKNTKNCKSFGTIKLQQNTKISAKQFVDPNSSSSYLGRHFEFSSENSLNKSPIEITFYLKQSDFDNYNKIFSDFKDNLLPKNPNDLQGKKNIVFQRFNGKSSNNSGKPNTYQGLGEVYNPEISNINWNPLYQRWEIKLEAKELGGFFVRTELPLSNEETIDYFVHIKNPISSNQIGINTNYEAPRYEVYDIIGRKVPCKINKVGSGSFEISIENFFKGVYFLKIENKEKVEVKKIIKL